jgi:altronate dehydratase small subunit
LKKFIRIHKKDNVVTALTILTPPIVLSIESLEKNQKVAIREKIPFGHKCAIQKILKGNPVIKYGEVIGLAVSDIDPGKHVHVHNLKSIRGTVEKV